MSEVTTWPNGTVLDKDMQDRTEQFFVNTASSIEKHAAEDVAALLKLIKEGIYTEAADKDGYTALHRAIFNNRSDDVVRALIAAGANIHTLNNRSRSTLMAAVMFNESSVPILIAAGANLDARDESGKSLLALATIINDQDRNFDALIKAGAEVNTENNEGATPLMYAASYNRMAMGKELIKRGALINKTCMKYGTALHEALRSEHYAFADMLLDNGANIYLCNKDGKCAYDMDTSLVKLTIKYGDFINLHKVPGSAEDVYHLLAAMPVFDRYDPLGYTEEVDRIESIFCYADWQGQPQAVKYRWTPIDFSVTPELRARAILQEMQDGGRLRAEDAERIFDHTFPRQRVVRIPRTGWSK